MGATPRGSMGFVSNPSKAEMTIAWPAGTAVGDLVVAELDEARPSPPGPGWITVGNSNVFRKVIDAADVAAGSFKVRTALAGLIVWTGAQGTGRTSSTNGVSCKTGGAAMYLAWSDAYDPSSVMGTPPNQVGSVVKDYTNRWNTIGWRSATADGYLQSTANPPNSFSVEIVPTSAPPAPLLSVPAPGEQVDAALPVALAWAHQGATPQEAYRVQVRPMDTGTWAWLDSAGALQTTEQTVSSSIGAATITAALSTSTYYEWKVATKHGGLWSDYSAAGWFFPASKPTVTSVVPTMPAESLDGTVAFNGTASSGAIVAWQVAVTPAAAASPASPMYLSPVNAVSGSGPSYSAGIPVLDWTNHASYKVWARVQQGGGLWSNWVSATFTVNRTEPAAPSSVMGVDGSPMQCVVSGVPAGKDVEAQWSMDGGVTWSPLGVLVAPGTAAVFDHPLAPYGVPVVFRARSLSVIDGVGLSSAWTASGPALSYDMGSYFVADDGAWVKASVLSSSPATPVQGVTVTYGLGASGPRVDSGPVQGHRGSLVIDAPTRAARDELEEWITTREVWTHRGVPEVDEDGDVDTPVIRMSKAAAPVVGRHVQAAYADRTISFDWVEIP